MKNSGAPQTTPVRLNLLERIGGVLVTPYFTFRRIREDPSVFQTLIVVWALSIVSVFPWQLFTASRSGGSPFQYSMLFYLIPTLIVYYLSFFTQFGLIAFFSYLFNGRDRWVSLLEIYCYSWVPLTLVKCALDVARHYGLKAPVVITPMIFFTDGLANPHATFLLSQISLSMLWALFVIFNGLKAVFDFDAKKAVLVCVYYYVSLLSIATIIYSFVQLMQLKMTGRI